MLTVHKKITESTRIAVEETPFIEIQSFKGLLEGETFKVTTSDGQINLCTINIFDNYFTVDWENSKDPQQIQIVYTSVGYGERSWFCCPSCFRRCGKLYCVYMTFNCRECHGLVYRSSKLSGNQLNELGWKIHKLQQRLGMNVTAPIFSPEYVGINDSPKGKPKRMKQVTYDHLSFELSMLQLQRAEVWARMARAALDDGRW